jgi:hypothetical protein
MKKTETKSILVEKMDEKGHGLARLATLSAVDKDGDTYDPGAFSWKDGGEQWAPMLPAHDRLAMPLGKSRVYEDGGVAYAELHLNLDADAGKQWHSHLKFDLATGKPAQEWSYGFGTVESVYEQRGEERVRRLKKVDVHEVSPVIRGAGVGTATLAMKSHGSFAGQLDAVVQAIDDVIDRAGEIAALRVAEGRDMSKARLDQLTSLKGRLDTLLAKSAICATCSGSGKAGGATENDALPCPDCKGTGHRSEGPKSSPGDAVAEALAADWITRAARRRAARI